MFLSYNNKICEDVFLNSPQKTQLRGDFVKADNLLFYGENIDVLKFLLKNGYAGKIDLVYIDPPFATNSIFQIGNDRVSTVSKSSEDKVAYTDKLQGSDFLEFIRLRLILLKELLSEKGSIYLHIDYKIGHYVKIIMDEVFGIQNFRNDITRIKCNPKNFSRKAFGNIKDLILFYSKGKAPIWNNPHEVSDFDDIESRFNKIDKNGRRYTTIPLHAPGETKNGVTGQPWRGILPPKGRHWRTDPKLFDELDAQGLIEWSSNGNPRKIIFADDNTKKGKKIQDVWSFKDTPYPMYPTEKNLDMIRRIIEASSNQDSIVLDCFCGSGTTLIAASQLRRKWIGIDKSMEAIKVTENRLDLMTDVLFEPYFKYEFN